MKKIFLNEAEKQKIIADKEKAIMESFAKTYNKIKRVDESNIELPLEKSVNEMGGYDNETLIDNIEGLEDGDIGWSNNPNKGLAIAFDWDNVDEELLLTQILNLIKKVNPNADLEKKKQSFVGSNILANFNSELYSASQKSFSAYRGLKNYFKDNLYMFK